MRTAVGEVLLTAVLLVSFAMFHHVLPRVAARRAWQEAVVSDPSAGTDAAAETPAPTPEATPDPRSQWQIRFAEHFTDEVVVTDRSYTSPHVSITITEHHGDFKSGPAAYFVADIYVADLDCFGACLAGDTFGLYSSQPIEDVAEEHNAILAINGDYYSLQLDAERSITVRNGEVYRAGKLSVADICVLFEDGTMETYAQHEYDMDELLERGVRHIWHFGPRLLLPDGSVNYNHNASVAISYVNPRTAVGYYEPGHYCFLVADGRQGDWSVGLRLEELAEIMQGLGCKAAYNLDGGGSSVMYFNGEKVNYQSNGGGREVGDALFIVDSGRQGGEQE